MDKLDADAKSFSSHIFCAQRIPYQIKPGTAERLPYLLLDRLPDGKLDSINDSAEVTGGQMLTAAPALSTLCNQAALGIVYGPFCL